MKIIDIKKPEEPLRVLEHLNKVSKDKTIRSIAICFVDTDGYLHTDYCSVGNVLELIGAISALEKRLMDETLED